MVDIEIDGLLPEENPLEFLVPDTGVDEEE